MSVDSISAEDAQSCKEVVHKVAQYMTGVPSEIWQYFQDYADDPVCMGYNHKTRQHLFFLKRKEGTKGFGLREAFLVEVDPLTRIWTVMIRTETALQGKKYDWRGIVEVGEEDSQNIHKDESQTLANVIGSILN